MKLSNFFKKNSKTVVKSNFEKLEKTQLEKVIGGIEALEPNYAQKIKTCK